MALNCDVIKFNAANFSHKFIQCPLTCRTDCRVIKSKQNICIEADLQSLRHWRSNRSRCWCGDIHNNWCFFNHHRFLFDWLRCLLVNHTLNNFRRFFGSSAKWKNQAQCGQVYVGFSANSIVNFVALNLASQTHRLAEFIRKSQACFVIAFGNFWI